MCTRKYESLLFLPVSAVLLVCVCLCVHACVYVMFRAMLIFQVGSVRLSFLPLYIMYVTVIYRLTKAASIHRPALLLLF